jgi:hypothetical protein
VRFSVGAFCVLLVAIEGDAKEAVSVDRSRTTRETESVRERGVRCVRRARDRLAAGGGARRDETPSRFDHYNAWKYLDSRDDCAFSDPVSEKRNPVGIPISPPDPTWTGAGSPPRLDGRPSSDIGSAYVRFAGVHLFVARVFPLSRRVFSLVSFVSLAVLRNRAFVATLASGLSYGKEPVPVAHAETGEVGHELGAGNCVPTSEARRRKPRDVAGRGFNI